MSKTTKQKQRDGFTFYRSFRDSIEYADPSEQLILYKAVADYALDGTEPDLATLGRLGQMCWTSLKPNIRAGYVRFANGCRGGAPAGNQNARKTTENQPKNNLKTSNTFINENENVDVYEKKEKVQRKKSAGKPRKVAAKRGAFVAPSLDELRVFVSEQGLTNVTPEEFIDHYTANGWTVGRGPMKDWRAAARNWHRRHEQFATTKPQTAENYETKPRYAALC